MILTIGHSILSLEDFHNRLQRRHVEVLVDVRSTPFSRHVPQFNRPILELQLTRSGIEYTFEGATLGGRPADPGLYKNGRASFERIAATAQYAAALDNIVRRSAAIDLVLMCSEHDPIECPRFLMVARSLSQRGIAVSHILGDDSVEVQAATETRLLRLTRQNEEDLFASDRERLDRAYRIQGERIGFEGPPLNNDS